MSDEQSRSRYDIEQSLAQGGMGEVLAARDRHFGRAVAMKVIRSEREASRELRHRFVQEARILSQLEHPNIVPVYDLDKDEQGRVFYTMKKVQGVTLKEVINQLKTGDAETVAKYPLTQLLTVFQKVCDAVAFAHSKGIVHRDLKPENIMLGDFGEVLVLDWGLAKVLPGRARLSERAEELSDQDAPPQSGGSGALGETRPTQPEAEGDSVEGFHEVNDLRSPSGVDGYALTLEGTILGTPQFMAPEQAEGRVADIDERTDIFSLGGILYSLLTLRPPTGGTTVKEVLANIKSGYIAPPVIYNQARTRAADGTELEDAIDLAHCPGNRIPDALSAVCMKAMAVDPADRYQRVTALQADIAAYQGGFATTAEQAGAGRRMLLWVRRNKAGAVSLCVLAAFLGYVVVSNLRMRATLTELRSTAPTFYGQAKALLEDQKLEDALEKITYAIKLAPDQVEYQLMKGNILQASLRFAEALAAYDAVVKLEPGNPAARENRQLCERLLREAGPKQPGQAQVRALHAALLQQRRTAEALILMRQILSQEKHASETGRQLFDTWKVKLDQAGLRPVAFQLDPDHRFILNLDRSSIDDLSVLRGMPVKWLSMNYTKISDLSPIQAMPLSTLLLGTTKVADLTPLRSMQLNTLSIWETKVSDLSPLAGMPLTNLEVHANLVTNLTPLKGMRLVKLSVNRLVKDLGPLKGMPLEWLFLVQVEAADYSPLRGLPLKSLNAAYSTFTDLRLLSGMPLEELLIGGTRITDLGPLRGLPLKSLSLITSPVSDLGPLQGMPLTVFDITQTKVFELTPLRGMKLENLAASYLPDLKDIRPLAGMPLKVLSLNGTGISDISALRGMPLKDLRLDGCQRLQDISPLGECRGLEHLSIPLSARNIEFLRQMPHLKKLTYAVPQDLWDKVPPIEEFWKAYDTRKGGKQ